MNNHQTLKEKIHTIIFGTDTPAGKAFDLSLIATIVFSVFLIILESIPSVQIKYHTFFFVSEWILTFIFVSEYFLRIYSLEQPSKYIFSFFGVVDLISSFATPFAVLVPGSQSLIVVRALRLLRIFRVLKLAKYFQEGMIIVEALKASRVKISVFMFTVIIIVLLAGTLMYLVEGPKSGFTNIPISMYWAIVTLTTVGYGDLAPLTNWGRFISSILMILGYAIIAVPTGIVTSELTKNQWKKIRGVACPSCGVPDHRDDSAYCYSCGEKL